jgi:serine/threonine protein kinase
MNEFASNHRKQPHEDNILKEEELTFRVYSELHGQDKGQMFEFYFRIKDGMPVKIGDGTFSAVFEVMGAGNKPHAVKILYEGLGQLAERRFRKEAKTIATIRKIVGDVDSIIEPVGYTEEFQESPAFRKLDESSRFSHMGLKLSNYALVTDLYKGTLKDLLEKPAPLAKDSLPEFRDKSGYEVLAQIDFNYRINTILPFLKSIADGLAEIHKAGYFHLDLKPDNIYYTYTVNEFKVVIGDLGFIGQPEISGAAMTKKEMAFGTRHYRSPEQKDFFDICEVEVLPASPDDKKKGEYMLVVRDPKFQDTIIEKGDNLMFSKDVHVKEDRQIMHHHQILDIEWKASNHAFIKIMSKNELAPDKRTQVEMYKQQATRTDLFGFGAVFFDILTCGRSPERFYGYLGNEDRPNNRVKDIREQYLRVASYSGEDPKYKGVFGAFLDKETQDYAPLDVVEIILKSMLYRAEGTFYNETVKDHHIQRWPAKEEPIMAAIRSLNKLKEKNYIGITVNTENPLIGGLRRKTQREDRGDLLKDIELLQDLPATELKRRIGHAAIRFNQLIELVDVSLKDGGIFFSELNPTNLRIRDKISFIYPKYERYIEYIEDLWTDTVYTKVLYDPMDPFFPEEAIGHMRRKIELKPIESNNDSAATFWKYRLLDVSPFGDEIYPADWVLLPGNKLAVIVEVADDSLVIKKEEKVKSVDKINMPDSYDENWEITELKKYNMPIKGIYYRKLDPFKYYTIILATYLYQLFFVGLQSNTRSEPLSIHSLRAQLNASPSLKENLKNLVTTALSKPAFKKGLDEGRLMSRLYHRLTALFLTLRLYDLQLSQDVIGTIVNDASGSDRETSNGQVDFKWFDVLKDISDCLSLNPGHLMSGAYLHMLEIDKIGQNDFKKESYFPQLNITRHIQDILGGNFEIKKVYKENKNMLTRWMGPKNWMTKKTMRG